MVGLRSTPPERGPFFLSEDHLCCRIVICRKPVPAFRHDARTSTGRVPAANRPPCPPSSRLLPGTSTASARGWRSSRNSSPRNARIYCACRRPRSATPTFPRACSPARLQLTSSSAASRCITASPSPAASRSARMRARLAGQWRGPARRRAPRLRHPARERLCPGRRRHSRPRPESQVRPEARLHRADDPLVGDLHRADHPGRRLQRGAARMRRVEPQATAQRGQPHAGRGRGADPAAASNGWVDLGRQFVPAPERLFTWWSYRSPDWTGTTAAGGSTICGRPATSPASSPSATASTSRAATGRGRPTMCR